MTCSAQSTLKPQASVPLPNIPGLTPAGNQAFKIWAQSVLAQIQGAAGATGVNVIPQQYALIAGSALPPIASTSNCTVTADTGTPLFGAGGSYKIAITGSPATVTFAVDTAWPMHPGSAWIASFFQQASAAIAGVLTITTPTKSYTTDFKTTLSASGFQRLYDTLNLIADTSTSFGLSFTFTGGTGQNVWLDGLMLEPYFGTAMQPSPFISTSGALLLDNNPDGSFSKILSTHTSGNVAYNFKGVWSSAPSYVIGDEVVYGQNYWLAVADSTNSAPSTGNANWQVVGSYSGYQGAWSNATAYVAGAEVTYSGNYWICVTTNTNSAPTTSNANWQIAGPKNLDQVADGNTYQRMPIANMDGNRRGLIDFAQPGHVNRSNLLSTAAWSVGSGGSQGNYIDADSGTKLSAIYLAGTGGTPAGPYGGSELLWIGYGGTSASASDGGWENFNDLFGIDPTKTYRSSVWINVASVPNGTIYFGCDGTYTNNLDGSQNTNPYFEEIVASGLVRDRWYLMVGVLHGSGYNGASSGISGIYDPTTGGNIHAGADLVIRANAPYQRQRVFLYGDTSGTGNYVAFARPRFEIMDGTEPSIQSMLAYSTDGLIDGSTFIRMPAPPGVSANASTGLSQSGTTTTINVAACSFYVGNITLNANSGSVNPGAYGTYYVYFDDPGYGGGAVTYQATTNALAVTQNPFRFYVGTITTASGGGGSGGGSGPAPCCLHESQMIELADGREVAARELTTDMSLLSHEGPTPIVQLRFLPHREWFKVRLDNGVELFVAGDHRFLDDDFNQIRAWDLKLQQRVRSRNGYAIVTGLDILWEKETKVAIEVGEPHTYYVQGILSHNKAMCP